MPQTDALKNREAFQRFLRKLPDKILMLAYRNCHAADMEQKMSGNYRYRECDECLEIYKECVRRGLTENFFSMSEEEKILSWAKGTAKFNPAWADMDLFFEGDL